MVKIARWSPAGRDSIAVQLSEETGAVVESKTFSNAGLRDAIPRFREQFGDAIHEVPLDWDGYELRKLAGEISEQVICTNRR